jgi:hypothetical protein
MSSSRIADEYLHAIEVTVTPRVLPLKDGKRLTPRITRRPKPVLTDGIRRVGGRVHALVRWRVYRG